MRIVTFSKDGKWPMRKIIGMGVDYRGIASHQLSCAHVVWDRPRSDIGHRDIERRLVEFQRGEEQWLPCAQCARCEPPNYPIGVSLPLPLPKNTDAKHPVRDLFLKRS